MKLFENIGKAGKFGGLGLLGIDALSIGFNDAVSFDDPAALGLLGADLGIAAVGYGLEKYEQKRDRQPV